MKPYLNELDHAQRMLECGFEHLINSYELCILARYYRYLGLKDRAIEKQLIGFCETFEQDFNYWKWYKTIDYAIKKSKIYALRIPVDVPITKNEMAAINSLQDERSAKVCFAMLAVSKYYSLTNVKKNKVQPKSEHYFYNGLIGDALRDSHLRMNDDEKKRVFHGLYLKGMIEATFAFHGGMELLFSDRNDNSPTEILITDMKKLMDYFPKKYYCKTCNKEFTKKSNRQIYCEECGIEQKKIATKNRVRKFRENVTLSNPII